ncbi:CHAT domain-containing protein [Nostoc flagelliforme FACHB-838]|uniref:CHAT domain-containing protein n=1 Tax=Nostoc flagelliforme FACHB-838 TaxID=2692904 RepID=A0ABR8DTY0_9NOSO|nr:CHAT domain-containing protein [Nostoc flagelliforme]MBD2532912.1 CHAT domain-containing protein [Nostoc flagelliforme FACHB-838]
MPNRYRQFTVRRFLVVIFFSSLTFFLWLNQVPFTVQTKWGELATAKPPNASQLVQQGIEQYRVGNLQEAIISWQTALSAYQNINNRDNAAIVREKLAIAYQQLGQFEEAINYWKEAIANYRSSEEFVKVGQLLTELAQTYSRLGHNKEAIALLCGASETDEKCLESEGSALQIAQKFSDRQGEVAALGSLGEAYHLKGKYDLAIETLEYSLKIAQENNLSVYRSSVFNSLGNAYFGKAQLNEQRVYSAKLRDAETKTDEFIKEATSDYKKALGYFNNSLELTRFSNDLSSQMRTLLNLIQLYYHPKYLKLADNNNQAEQVLQEALAQFEKLPNSSNKVYIAIDLAEIEQVVSSINSTSFQTQCLPRKLKDSQAEELLKKAVLIAQNIKDSRSESFALGKLGHLYECRKDYNKALDFTKQARLAADQKLRAKDSLYLWEWQAGRIFKAQAQESEAIAAYERAIATLEGDGGIRDNLLIAEQDLQFRFRDTISPLYREFARLKLERAESLPIASLEYQKELDSALDAIDSLKLAELQNYFGNDCVFAVFDQKRVDDLEREDTAIFNSIILEDRTAIVVSLPNQEKKQNVKPNTERRLKKLTWINDSKKFQESIKQFRLEIQTFYDPTDAFLTPAQNLYNWIIRPFADDLDQAKIKTIVFIQDGLLRSVPMAALHDGQEFLVQKYAIATTPGLHLTFPKPQNFQDLWMLALGLTEAVTVDGEKFKALENVADEVNQATKLFPGSKKLFNKQFTDEGLKQELKQANYPIIHIATHGQFGTIPEDSFLVTGNNKKITITQLESDIRRFSGGLEPMELLVLTACQTGVGDDRATLGMAGITVQAGVRSALASLWYVDDDFTKELAVKFYENLRSQMSKAEALKEAQKALINQNKKIHPAYWAPFILIGNWL